MSKLPIILGVIGVVVGVLALVFGFAVFPMIFKKKIGQMGQLVEGTPKWESWREVPIPVFQKITVFNVTNSEEVLKGGKPILQELGPYVYQQKRIKVDISVNEEKDTISYKHKDTYFFRADLSNGHLTDRITVLNLPYLGAVYKSMLAGATARYIVSEILTDFPENVYVNITVDEFFFGGYYVPFIKELSDMRGEALLPNNTFGLYYGKNSSESGTYEIKAGVKEPENFARVVSFNGQTALGLFEDERCDAIQGYDGSTMAPFLTRDKEFYLFVPALCRKMKFTFEEDTEMEGIPAFRFTVPPFYLADVQTNPDNLCYCSNPGDNGEKCFKSGVWDLSACRQGTPMVMSFPHFYNADPEYLAQSVGLSPDKEKHRMTIILEPTAAISLQVAIRMQMNFALKPTKYFKQLKNIQEMLHPIFWVDQGVTLPPPTLGMIKDKLLKTQSMVRTGTWVGLGIGCLLFVVALLICFRKPKKSVYSTTEYKPRKVSAAANIYQESPIKSDWSQITPNEKYAKITSPPNTRAPLAVQEEQLQPFLPQAQNQNQNGYIISNPMSSQQTSTFVPAPVPVITYRPHSPAIRTNSNPVIVGLHPKVEDNAVTATPAPDEVDALSPRSQNTALGVPFPPQKQFSSTGSMNRDFNEIDNTLQGINDALSSYENLKHE